MRARPQRLQPLADDRFDARVRSRPREGAECPNPKGLAFEQTPQRRRGDETRADRRVEDSHGGLLVGADTQQSRPPARTAFTASDCAVGRAYTPRRSRWSRFSRTAAVNSSADAPAARSCSAVARPPRRCSIRSSIMNPACGTSAHERDWRGDLWITRPAAKMWKLGKSPRNLRPAAVRTEIRAECRQNSDGLSSASRVAPRGPARRASGDPPSSRPRRGGAGRPRDGRAHPSPATGTGRSTRRRSPRRSGTSSGPR